MIILTQKGFKVFLPVLVLLLTILLLAGCGGDSTTTTAPAQTTSVATTAPAQTTVAPTTAASAQTTRAATTAAGTTVAATTAAGSTTIASSTGGLTMKEAYAQAESQIKAWQADQFLFSIFNSLDSGVGINPDGRSAEWNFQAVSVKANKRGTWLVKAGADGKPGVSKTGDEDLLPADAKASSALPPVSSLIDSSQLMTIAKQNGGDKSDSPVGFFLSQPVKFGDPLAVDLVFYKGSNVVRLRVDMQSGKLVANDKG